MIRKKYKIKVDKNITLATASILVLITIILFIEYSSPKNTGYSVYSESSDDYGLADWAAPSASLFDGWKYRQNITINGTEINATITNYTFIFQITDQNNPIFANALSNGNDIRFANSTGTELTYRRRNYVSTGGSKLFEAEVLLPTITQGESYTLFLYYGNSGASDVSNTSGATWNSNVTGAFDYDTLSDATSTHHNLTASGNAKLNTEGTRGNGSYYDGNGDYFTTTTTPLFDGNKEQTILWWMKANDTTNDASYHTILDKFSNTEVERSYAIRFRQVAAGNNRLMVTLRDNSTEAATYPVNDEWILNGTELNDGNWHQVAVSWNFNTGNWKINKDGQLWLSQNILNTSKSQYAGGTNRAVVFGASVNIQNYNGSLDEVLFTNKFLSDAEINTNYNNLRTNTTFYTTYAEESAPNVTLNAPANASSQSAGNIQFNFTTIRGSNSIQNCTLYHNSSGTFSANATTTTLTNNTNTNITVNMAVGTYTWNVRCYDTVGLNSFATNNYSVTITDSTPPTISFQGQTPNTGVYQSSTFSTINVSVVDSSSSIGTCLLEWAGTNESMTKTGSGASVSCNTTKSSLTDGFYSYKAYANDSAGNMNVSITRNMTVDIINPSVTLNNPSNNSLGTSTIVSFNTSISDNNLNNVTLIINGVSNETNSSATNGTYIFSKTLSEGTHNWSILAYDKAGNSNQTGTITLTIDTTNPEVLLITPSNNSYTSSTTINFTVNSTDRAVNNVTIYIDNILNETNSSGTNGTHIFSKTLSEGTHTWNILSYDTAGNSNQSGTRTVTIDTTSPSISASGVNSTTGTSGNFFTINLTATDSGVGINTSTTLITNAKNLSVSRLHMTFGSGVYTATWNTTGYSNGSYIVGFEINDSLGHTTNLSNQHIILLTNSQSRTFKNTSVQFIQQQRTMFNSTDTTGATTIEIFTETNITNASILIASYESNTENNTPTGSTSMNKTVHVILDNNTNSNISSAYLNVTYNDTTVTTLGITESTLRFYKFNTSTNNWTAIQNTNVDTTNNIVWANLTSFSIYGIFGNVTIDSGSGSSGSSGSSGGSSDVTGSTTTSIKKNYNYTLQPANMNVKVIKGETTKIVFTIENKASSTQEFNISFVDISEFIFSQNNTRVKIEPGKNYDATITIVGIPEKDSGIYIGKIIVSNGKEEKSMDVIIELSPKSALFDVKTSILPRFKRINAGQTLPVSVELFNFGNTGKTDVYVTYKIINSTGTKILEEQESIAVETTTSTLKEIHLPENVPEGTYIVFVLVKYNSKEEATSSTQFEIVQKTETQSLSEKTQNIFGGAIGITNPTTFIPIIFTAIIIIAIILYRSSEKTKKYQNN